MKFDQNRMSTGKKEGHR